MVVLSLASFDGKLFRLRSARMAWVKISVAENLGEKCRPKMALKMA
jgi:hypothetical protein